MLDINTISDEDLKAMADKKIEEIRGRFVPSDEAYTEAVKIMTDLLDHLKIDHPLKWHHAKGMRDVRDIANGRKYKCQHLQWDIIYDMAYREAASQFVPEDEDTQLIRDTAKISGGEIYTIKNEDKTVEAIYLEAPLEHHCFTDENGKTVLSNHDGPAILFRDGSRGYAVDDIFDVPEWLVMTKAEDLDPAKVLQLENVDHRRLGVEKIGLDRMIEGADLRHTDEIDSKYKLYDMHHLFDGVEDVESAFYLKMECVSGQGVCVEGVPNECRTVQDALDFRAGGIAWRPGSIDGVEQEGGKARQYQQGDVNMLSVDSIPDGFKPIEKKSVLSDRNQIRHTISSGTLYQKGDDQSVQYWKIPEEASLLHPDHGTVSFETTTLKLWPVVQLDHITGMEEPVLD